MLLAEWLLSQPAAQAGFAALAFLVAFDLYLRPAETLRLSRRHVYAPSRNTKGYKDWAVVVAPVEVGTPSKTGIFDQTLVAGTPKSSRAWIKDLVALLYGRTTGDDTLFDNLNIHGYVCWIKAAVLATGLTDLKIVPHTARHGGPSEDAYSGVRNLDAIQVRGRWAALESVARDTKFGMLLRQINKMSATQQRRGESLVSTLPAVIFKWLRSQLR